MPYSRAIIRFTKKDNNKFLKIEDDNLIVQYFFYEDSEDDAESFIIRLTSGNKCNLIIEKTEEKDFGEHVLEGNLVVEISPNTDELEGAKIKLTFFYFRTENFQNAKHFKIEVSNWKTPLTTDFEIRQECDRNFFLYFYNLYKNNLEGGKKKKRSKKSRK